MNKLHERKKAGEELTKTEKKFAKPTNFGKWDEDFTMEKLEEFIELFHKKLKPGPKSGGICVYVHNSISSGVSKVNTPGSESILIR